MNHCIPDWSMEDEYRSPSANQRKSTRPDHELVELLWQNGHVVMHSQTHRKTMTSCNEMKQCRRPETSLKCGPFENSTKIVDEEESASWLQYPIDDSFDKEFCSDFYGLPTESRTIDKMKDVAAGERLGKYGTTEENNMEYIFKQSNDLCFEENVLLPPKSQVVPSFQQSKSANAGDVINFSHFSRALKTDLGPLNGTLREKNLGNKNQGEVGETPSMMMKGSSICGSNQVHDRFDVSCCDSERVSSQKVVKGDAHTGLSSERGPTDTHETTITSSSGGLGCSFGRTDQHSAGTKSQKRKGRDTDESESQSEEAEYQSIEANRPGQRSASARRTRAAEVHNLAERRRRDRINEKMKALQELIPHCNKSDKASMLDEAIEYLKSLQIQLQMMWMGSGMAAMMFPGVQHYMSPMGIGMGHGAMPSVHGPIPFPRVPLVSQSMPSNPTVGQASVFPPFASPVNFQNQIQSAYMPESYTHYLGLNRMQPSPQAMNLYGSQLMQQNQTALAGSSGAPCDVAVSENIQNIKTGQGKI